MANKQCQNLNLNEPYSREPTDLRLRDDPDTRQCSLRVSAVFAPVPCLLPAETEPSASTLFLQRWRQLLAGNPGPKPQPDLLPKHV